MSGFLVWAYAQETVPKVTKLKIRSDHVAHCYTLRGGVLNKLMLAKVEVTALKSPRTVRMERIKNAEDRFVDDLSSDGMEEFSDEEQAPPNIRQELTRARTDDGAVDETNTDTTTTTAGNMNTIVVEANADMNRQDFVNAMRTMIENDGEAGADVEEVLDALANIAGANNGILLDNNLNEVVDEGDDMDTDEEEEQNNLVAEGLDIVDMADAEQVIVVQQAPQNAEETDQENVNEAAIDLTGQTTVTPIEETVDFTLGNTEETAETGTAGNTAVATTTNTAETTGLPTTTAITRTVGVDDWKIFGT